MKRANEDADVAEFSGPEKRAKMEVRVSWFRKCRLAPPIP